MKHHKHFVFLFSLFLLLNNKIIAQELWYPGWVVLNNGDTLKGKVSYNLYTLDNFRFAKIKDAKGSMRKVIAQHMLAYKVSDYRYKRIIVKAGGKDIADDQAMVKCVTEGEVEVWEYEFDPHVARPSMPKAGGLTEGTQKDYYLSTKGAAPVFISRMFWVKDIEAIVEDDALLQEILDEKKYKYDNIPALIAEYNQRRNQK